MCETLRSFQTEDFQVPNYQLCYALFSTRIFPPDSLNSGKNPSQTDLPFGHPLSVNNKPPVTLVCLAIRDNHLSTSAHGAPGQKSPMRSQSACFIAMDDNAGVESMERCRIFVRRGEGLYKRRSITRVVRAGNGGRWRRGGIPLVEVSVRSVIIVSAQSENTQRPRTM